MDMPSKRLYLETTRTAKGCPKYIFTTFHVQNYEHKHYQVGGDNLVIIALGFWSTMTIISAIVQTNAVDSEDRKVHKPWSSSSLGSQTKTC